MEACQHIPVLHRKEEQGRPEETRVQCRRCAVATEWEALPATGAWNKWAALMVQESDALRKAADARAEQVDPSLAAKAADSLRWRVFCQKVNRSPSMDPSVAALLGDDFKALDTIVNALRQHLRGPLTERRIHDLFVALRKANKAFAMNATDDGPDEGVVLDRLAKGITSRVAVEMEKQAVDVFARLANRLNHEVAKRGGSPTAGSLLVTFTGKGGYEPDIAGAATAGLRPGRKYEVLAGLVDRNSTRLFLAGINGGGFNSVMFDGVDYDHPCMHRMYP